MESVCYIDILKKSFKNKQNSNKKFSMRSYAKFLGISPATLSAILNNKRPLPLAYIEKICFKLNLNNEERASFLNSLLDQKMTGIIPDKTSSSGKILDDKIFFNILTKWEHFAILSLLDLDNFSSTIENIEKKLNIEKEAVIEAIARLKKAGFLKEDENKEYKRTTPRLKTTEDLFSKAIQIAHKKELLLALKKIDEIPPDKRDFSSITMPTNTKNIMKAKALIRKFRKDMSGILETGEKTEVYKLCVNLFPLTRVEKEK
jgi:uncharacterized protein (TIGR02147 family)